LLRGLLDSDEATVVKGLADELQHLVVVHLGKGKAVQTKVADEVACLHQVVAIQTSQHPKRPVRVYLVVPALGVHSLPLEPRDDDDLVFVGPRAG
jgi:hypothetical protein